MSERLIFNCTHGAQEPERATLPFIAANVAAIAGQKATVVCTIDAVWLGTDGGREGIAPDGLPVLDTLYTDFIANGGEVWLCQSCTKPRGITEDQLSEGATIQGAARFVEELVNGAKAISLS